MHTGHFYIVVVNVPFRSFSHFSTRFLVFLSSISKSSFYFRNTTPLSETHMANIFSTLSVVFGLCLKFFHAETFNFSVVKMTHHELPLASEPQRQCLSTPRLRRNRPCFLWSLHDFICPAAWRSLVRLELPLGMV